MACQKNGESGGPALKKARAYAQDRANVTGKPYVVTQMGHAFMLAGNKKLARELGGVAFVCRRSRRK